ncbi:MAG: hypothetical protein KDD82_21215, partial [Planctomycetes bacterium]|nr:hypothetical protein [Planctomycetota bacterium]
PPPPAPPPAASATKAPPVEPASADEPPPRLAHARWPLPLEFGRVHAAAWLGDRLLLAFQWRTSLYEADGREVASWPTALHPLAWTGDALFARDERDTFLLRADGTPPSKVLPFPAESCDPVAGRLVVRGEGELRAFDASGTLLRRFPLPDGLTPKQAFATPERLLVVVDAPNPRFLAFPWGPGAGQFVEGDLSPGRLDLRLSPDRERMALSGQSGFVWIYDAADLEAPPLRLRRARPEETSLARMFHVPHLVGVRGVLFWGDRLLTWGRGDTESDLLIWTRQGELEAVRSAAEVQALALGAHGMLARISKDQVEVFPAEELLERE